MNAFLRHALFLALACVFVLASCGRSSSGKGAATPEAGSIPAAPSVSKVEIRVVQTEGSVELLAQDEEARPVGPGDEILEGQSLRTGPASSCDLEIAGLGSLRIQPSTTLRVDLAQLIGGAPSFRSQVESGRVLAVVRKLMAKDSFILSSKNAICGVRGTSFSLESNGERSLVVVAEGKVAVVPAGPALSRLEAQAATSGAARSLLRAVVAMAPVASAGDELSIGSVEAQKADSALTSLEASLPAEAAGTVPAPGEPEALITAGEVEGAAGPAPLPDLEAAFPSASPAGAAARLVIKALADFASDVEERVSGQIEGQSPSSAPSSAAPAQAEPKKSPAILASVPVSQGRRLDSLVRSGNFLVATDASGSIVCLDAKGKVIWKVPLEKGSRPVLSKGYLYVSGTREFVVINATSGAVERGPALPSGARLAAFPDGAVAASSAGISLFRSGSAGAWTTFPVNGGPLAVMSLNDKANNLLVSLVPGGLAIVSPGDSQIAAVAPGPVASCLRYYGSRAVAAGAKAEGLAGGAPGSAAAVPAGTASGAQSGGIASGSGSPAAASYEVALYALPELEILWSLTLALKPEADPELGPEGAFVYGQGRLEAYSLAGEAIGRLSGLSAPPLLSNGMLYYGLSDGSFVAAQASNLAVKASIRLPAALAARPIPFEGELRLPLADGSIVALDPKLMGK